jgi:signal transduction histidine kinase
MVLASVVTCSMILFLRTLHVELPDVRSSAILTFLNILLISFVLSVLDGVRYKYTVERPVKQILKATQKMMQGDLTVRIEPLHGWSRMDEFDVIIHNFNRLAEELSGMETLRTDFVANVSHELKTPLAVIQNYATMLQTPQLPESQRIAYGRTIAHSAQQLSELVSNILRLNKLENQTVFFKRAQYNLGEQVRECVLTMEDAWERKELKLNIDIDDVQVEADAEMLSLVWNNLLSNAIKFTAPGGTIGISVKEQAQWVEVCVADSGCGMDAEVGKRIFEKFYQGDSSHKMQGNGLGLALVKRIVDIIGGEISVKSTVNVGSSFTVRLPKETA